MKDKKCHSKTQNLPAKVTFEQLIDFLKTDKRINTIFEQNYSKCKLELKHKNKLITYKNQTISDKADKDGKL